MSRKTSLRSHVSKFASFLSKNSIDSKNEFFNFAEENSLKFESTSDEIDQRVKGRLDSRDLLAIDFTNES